MLGVLIIVGGAFLLQGLMSFLQMRHLTNEFLKLRRKGKVAFGRKSGGFRAGAVVMFGIDDEGTGEAVGEIAEEEQPSEVTEEAAGIRYENENIGVGVLLDEDWVIYNDEQLAQLSGLTAEMFSDEKYKEMMEKSNSFTDFFAQHSSGASMNVLFENLGLLYGSVLSEEQYRTAAMQNMAGAYESAGFENVQIEENTVDFAGAERVGIHTSCTVNGVNYYVQQVLIKAGSHMGIISLCCFVQDDTPLMASFFYPLG